VLLQARTYQQLKTASARLADDSGDDGRPLSPKTVHNVRLCLRRALRDAVRARLLALNTAEAAHRLAVDNRPETQAWTAAESRALLVVRAPHPLDPDQVHAER